MRIKTFKILMMVLLLAIASCAEKYQVNKIMVETIKSQDIDISRWGKIGRNIKHISVGMPKQDVLSIMGEPDKFPMNKFNILQYPPEKYFHGGDTGPDWNLLITFDEKELVEKFEFVKWLYGPDTKR